jgi:2-dehydro-3-deoxyphosphogalactonate aldolase
MDFYDTLNKTKLIAILRGITPKDILKVANILVNSGYKIIEVPLNSPDALKSIEILVKHYENQKDIYIGAGTVLDINDIKKLKSIGAKLIVTPNINIDTITQTIKCDMIGIYGFLTPTEAFCAIKNEAKYIKLFPFETFGLNYYNNIKAVLPTNINIIAVGGINLSNIDNYIKNGIKYFGLGGSLYNPKMSFEQIQNNAISFMEKLNQPNQ